MKRRRPHPPPLPLLLRHLYFLFLLLLLLLPVAHAQPEPISLADTNTHTIFVTPSPLPFNTAVTYRVELPAPGFVLVEALDTQEIPSLSEEGRPYIFLAAAQLPDSTQPPDETFIITEGNATTVSALHNKDYKCSVETPCFLDSPDVSIDAAAVFTHDRRAFVTLKVPNAEDPSESIFFQVTLRNLDRNRTWGGTPLTPELAPSLRFSYAQNSDKLPCPGFVVGQEEKECSGNGQCEKGECRCNDDYQGLLCEARVHTYEELQKDGQSLNLTVPPFSREFISWKQQGDASRVQIWLGDRNGTYGQGDRDGPNFELAVSLDNQNPAPYLKDPPPLPSVYNSPNLRCGGYKSDHIIVCVLDPDVEKEQTLLIAIITQAIKTDKSGSDVDVQLRLERCNDGEPCEKFANSEWLSIPIVVVPVCVATIVFTALGIAIMLWLDRQHGFTNSVDRLSVKELDRMYPTQRFSPTTRDDAETVVEEDCLICLSKFEDNEVVRKLQCHHIYHSECLDPWITQNNASCPACRCDVRIQGLSDRRRLRRVVTLCLSPIVWIRNLRVRRSGERSGQEADERPSLDLEVGTGHSASVEPENTSTGETRERERVASTEQEEEDGIQRVTENR